MNTKKIISILAIILGIGAFALGVLVVANGENIIHSSGAASFSNDFNNEIYKEAVKIVNATEDLTRTIGWVGGGAMIIAGCVLVGNALIVLFPDSKLEPLGVKYETSDDSINRPVTRKAKKK